MKKQNSNEAVIDGVQDNFKVFYDGSCPICTREIGFYKKRSGADDIEWVDITSQENEVLYPGLDKQKAMKRFHIATPEGELIDGGNAFAQLWRQLPAFKWAGSLFASRPMIWLLDRAYDCLLVIRPFMQRYLK